MNELNPDEENVLVLLNGEIWNYRQLATKLGIEGTRYSEVEVVRAAYLTYGNRFASLLDGMYAIVVADLVNSRLVVTRDNFGIKPLFYALSTNCVRLSSEIATLAIAASDWDINESYLANRAVFGFSDYNDSILAGTCQIPPGSTLVFSLYEGSIITDQHVQRSTERRDKSTLSPVSANETTEFSSLLEATKQCVTHHDRRPNERVILLLSGGIDSTALCACVNELQLNDAVEGVFVGAEGSIDERYAIEAARIFNLKLTTLRPNLSYEFNNMERVAVRLGGQPSVGLHSLFRQLRVIRPHAKIVICGEGADELYAGYPWHSTCWRYLAGFRERAKLLPTTVSTELIDTLIPRIEVALGDPDPNASRRIVFEIDRGFALVERHLIPFDHASMAFGFEVRVPYLESANSDLTRFSTDHLGGSTDEPKSVLREILRMTSPKLSEEFLGRRKVGFPNAFSEAIRDEQVRRLPSHPDLFAFAANGDLPYWYRQYYSGISRAITGD